MRNLGSPPISVLSQMHDRWPDLVGPALCLSTRPVELVDGVLVVACDDSTGASQIGWMENQIKARFGEVFSPDLVQRVKVRVDPL